jgi:uncharacterized membrane protein
MHILINVLHVVAAVFIIGPMAILPMTAMRSIRAGQAGHVATLAKSVNLFTLLSIVVAFFGFGALGLKSADDAWSFSSTWVWLSLVLYVVALAINLFLVVPALTAASESLATDATSAKAAGYPRIAAGSGVASLLLVLVVVLMVWKP